MQLAPGAAHQTAIRDSIVQIAQSVDGIGLRPMFTFVADIEVDPAAALRDFKAYASRCLKEQGLDPDRRKRWVARQRRVSACFDRGACLNERYCASARCGKGGASSEEWP